MLQTIEEIQEAEQSDPGVANGIDNPNLMSVDSTEPVQLKVENVDEEGKVTEGGLEIKEKEEEVVVEETVEEVVKPDLSAAVEKKVEVKPEDLSKSVQKRIGALTKKWRVAEREANYKDGVIADLKKELTELKGKIPAEGKPDKADYEDDDEYIEALTEWKVDTKLAASQNEKAISEATDEQKQDILSVYDGIDEAIEAGKVKYADFVEVTDAEDVVLSAEVMQLALDTEVPEDILYYLCSNPDESERISSLSAVKGAKEIVKLEAKFTEVTAPKTVKKAQSKAPAPIKPVQANGVTDKDPDKMTPKEYREWRSKTKK